MNHFTCSTCGEQHKLETLIEFPQPHIVGEIIGDNLGIELGHFAKNMIAINREYFLIEVELKIKITDYEDELDIMVWSKIDGQEFKKQCAAARGKDLVFMEGRLMHFLPYYDGTENLPIRIELTALVNEDTPKVVEILKDISLKHDFENGITLKELTAMLEKYYHDESLTKEDLYSV